MLSRLPVMQPTIGPPETTPETSCDSTEPEAKRTKRSEEHNPFAVFQEVRSRRSRQPKTSRRAELRPCRSQIRDTLDAHRQRETKRTTDAELQLLVELWGRMARREARAFEFVFKKCVKGQMIEVTFTAKSVERKLAQLKKVLKEEHYAFPAHTPPDEVAVMYPMYKQLLDGGSRQEVRKRPDHAPPRVSDNLDLARCADCEVQRVRHVHVGGVVNSDPK